jgi:hypothetical protein
MAQRFKTSCQLSDKQVAFALKLADEVRNPPPAERHVAAPIEEGRQVVRGRVVSLKVHEGHYGDTLKMTVKIETPDGSWLVWGTCPSAIAGDHLTDGDVNAPREMVAGVERGDEVEFSAKLKPGRDEHFALFSRPTKATIVRKAEKDPR